MAQSPAESAAAEWVFAADHAAAGRPEDQRYVRASSTSCGIPSVSYKSICSDNEKPDQTPNVEGQNKIADRVKNQRQMPKLGEPICKVGGELDQHRDGAGQQKQATTGYQVSHKVSDQRRIFFVFGLGRHRHKDNQRSRG